MIRILLILLHICGAFLLALGFVGTANENKTGSPLLLLVAGGVLLICGILLEILRKVSQSRLICVILLEILKKVKHPHQ